MKLDLAFFAKTGTEAEGLALAWASSEPNVAAAVVVTSYRPFPDRQEWWNVSLELTLGGAPQFDAPTMWEF